MAAGGAGWVETSASTSALPPPPPPSSCGAPSLSLPAVSVSFLCGFSSSSSVEKTSTKKGPVDGIGRVRSGAKNELDALVWPSLEATVEYGGLWVGHTLVAWLFFRCVTVGSSSGGGGGEGGGGATDRRRSGREEAQSWEEPSTEGCLPSRRSLPAVPAVGSSRVPCATCRGAPEESGRGHMSNAGRGGGGLGVGGNENGARPSLGEKRGLASFANAERSGLAANK